MIALDSSRLFLNAFGDGAPEPEATSTSRNTSPRERQDLFKVGFGTPDVKIPTPNFSSWRINNQAANAKLSFSEIYQLGEYIGTPYDQLPAWIRDSGCITVDRKEKSRQADLTRETGLDLSERQQQFNAKTATIEALAAMSSSELLRDSEVLQDELAAAIKRFGQDDVMAGLATVDPSAAKYYAAKLRVAEAEAKVLATQQRDADETQSVADEIAAAQIAINELNENDPTLVDLSTEKLRFELTRRASTVTREAAEGAE